MKSVSQYNRFIKLYQFYLYIVYGYYLASDSNQQGFIYMYIQSISGVFVHIVLWLEDEVG